MTKAGVAEEDVLLRIGTHDGDRGHRGVTTGVRSDDTVFSHGHGHQSAWDGKYTSTPGDLSTLTAITGPTDSAQQSYRRLFENPFTGDIFEVHRGAASGRGYVHKWNHATKEFDLLTAVEGVTGNSYGKQMAFADGVIYLTVDIHTGGAGFPRRDTGLVKSVDGGATWTDMLGNVCSDPIEWDEATIAFPTDGELNVHGGEVAVSGGKVLMIAEWLGPTDDEYRSLWLATWNTVTEEFDTKKLMSCYGHVASSGLTAQDGMVFVVAQENRTDGGALWLLSSDDDGDTWTRYLLDSGTAQDDGPTWGAYIDQQSYGLDGVVRILPMYRDKRIHEVWELSGL